MKNKLFFVLVMAFSVTKATYAAPTNTTSTAITAVNYLKDYNGLLVAQQLLINPESCQQSYGYILPKEHPHYKEISALILAAHLSGQPLMLGLNGCYQGYPSIENIISYK